MYSQRSNGAPSRVKSTTHLTLPNVPRCSRDWRTANNFQDVEEKSLIKGRVEYNLATRLVHEGFVVSVINPAQAHHFAKALLKRAKTDAIDAPTLAQLATVLHPEPWTLPPPIDYA